MPLQNRVTPFGEIVAIPKRGTLMGNRGILHDDAHHLRRPWASRAWICCVLEWRGRRDPVMAPGHYTRLFFLDEPTALAAGHRACAYCRRAAYVAFRDAWAVGRPDARSTPKAAEIDGVLHGERTGPGGSKQLHRAKLAELPDGVLFTPVVSDETGSCYGRSIAEKSDTLWVVPHRGPGEEQHSRPAFLVWRGQHWRWSPSGYRAAVPSVSDSVLTLTPPSIVAALASGYQPEPPFGLPDESSP